MLFHSRTERDVVHMQSLTLVAFAALAVTVPMIAQEAILPATAAAITDEVVVATTAASEYTPMSTHERWHGYLHENLLSSKFALQVMGTAFIEHISKDPKEWGVGARGYFHRVQDRFLAAPVSTGRGSPPAPRPGTRTCVTGGIAPPAMVFKGLDTLLRGPSSPTTMPDIGFSTSPAWPVFKPGRKRPCIGIRGLTIGLSGVYAREISARSLAGGSQPL